MYILEYRQQTSEWHLLKNPPMGLVDALKEADKLIAYGLDVMVVEKEMLDMKSIAYYHLPTNLKWKEKKRGA